MSFAMMKRRRKWILTVVAVGVVAIFVVYGIPQLFFPTKVWFRKTVRDHPLQAPIAVTSVRNGVLHTAQQEFRIAAVKLPTDPAALARVDAFLHVATAQGIEVIRALSPDGASLLRCEPLVWGTYCSYDPVMARYRQYNLSELLVALDLADADTRAAGLTDDERSRLAIAAECGSDFGCQLASYPASAQSSWFDRKRGIARRAIYCADLNAPAKAGKE